MQMVLLFPCIASSVKTPRDKARGISFPTFVQVTPRSKFI